MPYSNFCHDAVAGSVAKYQEEPAPTGDGEYKTELPVDANTTYLSLPHLKCCNASAKTLPVPPTCAPVSGSSIIMNPPGTCLP